MHAILIRILAHSGHSMRCPRGGGLVDVGWLFSCFSLVIQVMASFMPGECSAQRFNTKGPAVQLPTACVHCSCMRSCLMSRHYSIRRKASDHLLPHLCSPPLLTSAVLDYYLLFNIFVIIDHSSVTLCGLHFSPVFSTLSELISSVCSAKSALAVSRLAMAVLSCACADLSSAAFSSLSDPSFVSSSACCAT